MAWMKLETAVARNRKFVKAGPGPSWLWVCGIAYCQESLTDGFIPEEALPYLGVKSAANLVKHLVSAGLWDIIDGGWMVHDYLQHNRSSADIDALKERRAAGGKLGGRPKQKENLPPNLQGSEKETLSQTFPVDVADGAADGVADLPLDMAFRSFQGAYPSHRRKGGHIIEVSYIDQTHKAGGANALMLALKNHLASEQWADSKLIPGMDVWLSEERWRQTLPAKGEAGPSSKSNVEAWKTLQRDRQRA
jgi:hypothetical protein